MSANNNKGLIRYLVVVIDGSSSSLESDFRPNRLDVCTAGVYNFIKAFFEQNPISQMSIVITKDRTAEKLTEMSSNPRLHLKAVRKSLSRRVDDSDLPASLSDCSRSSSKITASGLASLQNSLLLALHSLQYTPGFGAREVLFLYNSLGTCDPGNIHETVLQAQARGVHCSAICTAAEVYICRKLTTMTGGSFGVALNSVHFQELLLAHVTPRFDSVSAGGAKRQENNKFLMVGFPTRKLFRERIFGFDTNFLGASNNGQGYANLKMMNVGYTCQRCETHVSDIPAQCPVCGLQLLTCHQISRSQHFVFPVAPFIAPDDGGLFPTLVEPVLGQSVGEESTRSKRKLSQVDSVEGPPLKLNLKLLQTRIKHSETLEEGNNSHCKCCFQPFDMVLASTANANDSDNAFSDISSAASNVARKLLTGTDFNSSKVKRRLCKSCNWVFCEACDVFIHTVMHVCPGCS